MSPLEKVPFATFYPRWKYLCGTYFSKKRLFQVDSCIQFYRLTQLIFSSLFKGIIRKECQSFTNHGHDKTPPTVFNPLSLWLTLPRDMGVSHTLWSPGITRAILACLWFAQSWCSGWFYVWVHLKKYHSPLFTPIGSTCVAHIFQKKTFSSGFMCSILSVDATNFLNII